MLDNKPAGLERAEIERVVGNQYNGLLRKQYDSKALLTSGSTTTAGRATQPIRGQLLKLLKEGPPR